jgi:hypothetical protein
MILKFALSTKAKSMSSNVMKISICLACMIVFLVMAFVSKNIILSYINTIIVIIIGVFVHKNFALNENKNS